MEVHKHPHHITHKKKWGEYLLEFFMLFLAVFLGFLAENVRENRVDDNKEKEYMIAMLSDVEQDTISFNRVVAKNNLLIAGTDSAKNYLGGNLNDSATAKSALIYFYKYCVNIAFFHPNDGTITQLRNNGGLRLIRNKDVIDKINNYYRENSGLLGQESSINEFLTTNDKQAGEIFNYMTNKNFIDSANLAPTTYKIPLEELKQWYKPTGAIMLTTDAKALSPFLNNLSYTMGLMQTYIYLMERQKHAAVDLIHAIKENYSFKNE